MVWSSINFRSDPSGSPVKLSRDQVAKQLADDVEKYLSSGGQITQCPAGESGYVVTAKSCTETIEYEGKDYGVEDLSGGG